MTDLTITLSNEETRAVFNALVLATDSDGLVDDDWASAQVVLGRLRHRYSIPVGEMLNLPTGATP